MSRSPARARRTFAALLVPLCAVLLAACGGDDATSTPAAARENAAALPAATATSCTDPSTGVAVACAKDLRGPGGGTVFYDAGSPQSWGQFLEVAPQTWNGDLYKCPNSGLVGSSCGFVAPARDGTSDAGPNDKKNTGNSGNGYLVCASDSSSWQNSKPLAGSAGTTGTAIGSGRNNTTVLLAATDCTTTTVATAVTLAAAYQGGGLGDWYLPAKDELLELCRYGHRNAIGGFSESKMAYASSTAYPDKTYTSFAAVQFDSNCTMTSWGDFYPGAEGNAEQKLVRPIRAF